MNLPELPNYVLTDFPSHYGNLTLSLGTWTYLLGTLVSLGISIYIAINFFRYPMLRVLTKALLLMSFGLFFMNAFMFLYFYALLTTQSMKGFIYTNNGFLLFFILWVYSSNMYLYRTARVPSHRKKQFTFVFYVMMVEVVVLAILGFISIIYQYSKIVEYTALIAVIMGILSITYFYFALGREITENRSKLTQARLRIFQLLNALQLIWIILATLPNVILTTINLNEASQYPLLVIPLITIISSIFIGWAFNLPDFIRSKYGIKKERFERIKKIEDS